MQYICLRDCFVHDVYYCEGKTYDLPSGESPKNFKPLEEALKPPEASEPSFGSAELTDTTQAETPQTETEAKPKKKRKKKA